MKNSIKRAQSQACLGFAERKNFRPLAKLKKLSLTLALLITAAGGAWATDVYLVGNGTGNWLNDANWDPGVAGNKMTEQNGVYSITFTNVDANSELLFKFAINGTWDVNYGCTSWDANELNKTLSNIEEFGNNFMFGLTEAADVTISFNLSEMTYMISTKGMKVGDDAADVEVTTNAASKQDLFTEASFKMPAFDATVNYMLVRDMQDEANPVAFSGLPSSGNIIVKKGDDGKYQPADELSIQLIDPLAAADAQNIIAADGITIKVLVGNGGTPIEYDQVDPITLEAFLADMKPGYYWIKAEPTDENSPYDGTVYSSEFTVEEQYDLVVKPANDFSKKGLDKVTVGTEEVTPDATTGKATKTGIAPDTAVKIKAKRGYIIEKVETGKTEKLKTLSIGSVYVMELVYADGDTWKKVVERNSPKIRINEENQHILSNLGYLSWNENQEYKGDVVSTDVIDPNKEYFWNE